jgi:dTDP-4-dehydrorhamnose reductase
MRILLFGANGQVGVETRKLGAASPDIDIIAVTRADADLTIAGSARALILQNKPDAVLNAAAFTAVDKAESEQEIAAAINATAPGEMAAAAAEIGAAMVHVSTDYVFSGDAHTILDETAPTGPLNVYGQTKLDGEARVFAACDKAAVIRTSWVFAGHGANFVRTMLRLGAARDRLTIVGDQIGGPTPAVSIADACITAARALRDGGETGLFHFQGAPAVSWADFARAIFKAGDLSVEVVDIPTSDYPTPAKRPLRTVLDCSRIKAAYGVAQPDWRQSLEGVIASLNAE